ncbi:MAG: class I SAM-dependent methyltransferase [Bacillota bacterium]|nr:class I SAM-dependent methyltransferase [Bacillota bacterium]
MAEERLSYHQVQAMMGASSAHPGGFAATLKLLALLEIPPGLRVLECGCGTGRTACHLARQGARVTAVDRNPVMLAKAQRRGGADGVEVQWVLGDVLTLPFEDSQFDLVLAESLTVFNPIPEVLREYRRVLVPGGQVADLEMAGRPGLPPEARAELLRFYGAPDLPTAEGWREAYAAAGFDPVVLWGPHPIDLREPGRSQARHPDPLDLSDPGVRDDPRVVAVLWENILLMAENRQNLSYLGIIATRPQLSAGQ